MKRSFTAGISCLLLAGCVTMDGGNGGNDNQNDNSAPKTVDVMIENLDFMPGSVTVNVGDSVRWTNNEESIPHSVTSGNPEDMDAGNTFDSGTINPGETFSRTFNTAGTFEYFCTFHPTTMRDQTVIVMP